MAWSGWALAERTLVTSLRRATVVVRNKGATNQRSHVTRLEICPNDSLSRHRADWFGSPAAEPASPATGRGCNRLSASRRRCTQPSSESLCYKCGATQSEMLICSYCKNVQPLRDDLDYFTIFGLPKKFNVNLQALSTKYKRLQSLLHPDKHASLKEEELQRHAEAQSSLVNKAYDTLQKPVSRGVYLLSLYGIHVDEASHSNDTHFLADVMEANEELSECSDATTLTVLRSSYQDIADDICKQTASAFDDGRLQDATTLLSKLRYYVNLLEKVKEKEVFLMT